MEKKLVYCETTRTHQGKFAFLTWNGCLNFMETREMTEMTENLDN